MISGTKLHSSDITEMLNLLQTGLQGENELVTQMISKDFAFVEKLKMHIEEIRISEAFQTSTYLFKTIQKKVLV